MRSKHLIIFILILVSGLFIEGLKKIAGYSTDDIKPLPLSGSNEYDVRPFQLSNKDIARENARTEARSRQLRNSAKSSILDNHTTGGMKLQNATVKLADSTLKAPVDPKKKKKKKKNGRDQAGKDKKTETAKTDDKDKTTDKSMTDKFLNQNQPVSVAANTLNNNEANKLPVTYEDWAKLILGSPQPENVNKLVEYFKSRMVSGEIFYAILGAMMNESNPEQHSLAVKAAAQVQNAQSFQFIVEVIRSEKFGSKVAGEAAEALHDYSKLNALQQLRSVISGSMDDPTIAQIIMETLDTSTRIYLEGRAPSADTKPLTAEQIARYKKVFSPFATILPKIIQSFGTNRAITDPANRALTRIKNLMGMVVQNETKS